MNQWKYKSLIQSVRIQLIRIKREVGIEILLLTIERFHLFSLRFLSLNFYLLLITTTAFEKFELKHF